MVKANIVPVMIAAQRKCLDFNTIRLHLENGLQYVPVRPSFLASGVLPDRHHTSSPQECEVLGRNAPATW